MFLPFFCQKESCQIKAQQPFPSGRATARGGLSSQVHCGDKRQVYARIKAQNQVHPTCGNISGIVLKSASNKYLKATLRVGAESKHSGFTALHRNPSFSGLYRRAH
jgi:DNA polymerase II large subunit